MSITPADQSRSHTVWRQASQEKAAKQPTKELGKRTAQADSSRGWECVQCDGMMILSDSVYVTPELEISRVW